MPETPPTINDLLEDAAAFRDLLSRALAADDQERRIRLISEVLREASAVMSALGQVRRLDLIELIAAAVDAAGGKVHGAQAAVAERVGLPFYTVHNIIRDRRRGRAPSQYRRLAEPAADSGD